MWLILSIPNIESVDISDASHASFNGNFQSENCELKLKGASKAKGFNYTGNYLNIELDGASECTMSGETKDIKIDASGASSLYMFDMLTSNLNINLSGASNAENAINGIVTGKLEGASTLKYQGTADVSNLKIEGGSKVKKAS